MGDDINTYRRRIGTFHGHGRRSTAKTKNSEPSNRFCVSWSFDWYGFEEASAEPRFPRFTRAHARAGLLAVTLLSSLMLACVSQQVTTSKNLHDLSALLLQNGDIEENPGPSSSVQTDADLPDKTLDDMMALWDEKFRALERKTDKKLMKLEKELKQQRDYNYRLVELCENECKLLENDQLQIHQNVQNLDGNMRGVVCDLENRIRMADDQADKHEQILRRNNLKMFGVPERDREPYRECLDTVLQLFREAAPGVPWSEKDIIKVQRLGAPRRNTNYNRPRPLLVEISTFFDKLILLKYGREALRNRGISIASELTTRQTKILQDLREEGHDAYFWNNKLWFRDRLPPKSAPRSVDTRGKTRWREDASSLQPPRSHARSFEFPNVPQARHEEEWEQHLPPEHFPSTIHVEEGGTWVDPVHHWWLQEAAAVTEANRKSQIRQRQTGPVDPSSRDRQHRRVNTAATKEPRRQDAAPSNARGDRPDRWLKLKQDYHPKQGLRSPTVSESTGSQLNYFTDVEDSSDGFSSQESSPGSGHHAEGPRRETVGEQIHRLQDAIDRKNKQLRENQLLESRQDPKPAPPPKKQRTVLEWLDKPSGANPAASTPPSAASREAGHRHDDSEVPGEASSVWSGRLRQRQTSPNKDPLSEQF